MKNVKRHVKIELVILAFLGLSSLIFILYGKNYLNTYEDKIVEMQENLSMKEFPINDFRKLYAETDVKVSLKQGEPKVVIQSHDEIIDNIEIINVGNRLELRSKDYYIHMDSELKNASLITVYYNNLSEIRVEKNCYVKVVDTLATDPLEFKTKGNSKLNVNVRTQEIFVLTEGNSSVTIKGNSNFIEADSQGNSTINANGCKVKEATVRSSGNSSLRVFPTEKIEGHASANSSLYVKGNPIQQRTSSSGNARVKN